MRLLRVVWKLVLCVGLSWVAAAQAAALKPADDGLQIDGASLGHFTFSYPVLINDKPNQELKPVEKTVEARRVALIYANGAHVELNVAENGDVAIHFNDLPAGVKRFKMETLIGFDFSHGGKWVIDGKETLFPEEKPAKPHLFQGNGKSFQLIDVENRVLNVTPPEYSFLQLTDSREWNWKMFALMFVAPLDGKSVTSKLHISVGEGAGGVKKVVLVDEFGQDFKNDFAGKVKKLEELKADVESEKAYYDGFPKPAHDVFGGQPGSGAKLGLQKTGYFHVEQKGERWYLVDPEGNQFFHMGVCSFGSAEDYTYIKGRESVYAWLPPFGGEFHGAYHPEAFWSHDAFSFYLANVIRKYGSADKAAIAARMIDRVRALGFNSGGAFSGIPKEQREKAQFPYVASLPIGPWGEFKIEMIPGIRETFDPFEDNNRTAIEKSFAKGLPGAADDPLLIGYFLTNEPAHEDLVKVIPTLKGNIAAKRRLVQMLEEKYKTIAAFNQAWELDAASFEALKDLGLATKTHAAATDLKAFEGLFFEASHKLIHDTFHKYDTHHMLLGDRWQPQTADNEQLCGIVGKYCDIVSVNYYTYAVDLDYVKRVQRWSGSKPIFLSEFHWCSPKDSGLPGGKDVSSQLERGLAYRNYVERTVALGFVVGIEWFTLLDQARTGRFFEKYTGENANCGLFSVTDRPWKAMTDEMAKTNLGIYEVLAREKAPYVYDNPRFQINK